MSQYNIVQVLQIVFKIYFQHPTCVSGSLHPILHHKYLSITEQLYFSYIPLTFSIMQKGDICFFSFSFSEEHPLMFFLFFYEPSIHILKQDTSFRCKPKSSQTERSASTPVSFWQKDASFGQEKKIDWEPGTVVECALAAFLRHRIFIFNL